MLPGCAFYNELVFYKKGGDLMCGVYTNVGRVLVFLETHRVWVSEAFLIPDPVCFFYFYFYNIPAEGFKKLNFFVPRFQSAGF